MKEIPLTQDKVAKVSDHRFEYFNQWKWQAYCVYGKWYARRHEGGKQIKMHHVIVQPPDGLDVDHIDGDGLNNTDENLRVCTHAQNMSNQKMHSNNLSGFKGVRWAKWANKWRSQIQPKGQFICLGYFDDPEEAARAYDEKAKELFGEFARTNF